MIAVNILGYLSPLAAAPIIILKSGHHLYGYSGDSDAQMWSREQYTEWFAEYPEWLEAIRDIPALYGEYEPY
jgi:hypothetical protein